VVARFLLSAESMVQDAGLSSMSNASAPEYPRSEDMGLKLEQVNAMLQRFPQNIELLAYKANLCILAGDANGAIEVLSQAPEPAREDARFWRLEGWIHESNQELDKAVSAYRRALELHATDWNTMFRLSVVERHRQNLSEVKRLTELVNRALVLRSEFREAPGSFGQDPSVLTELAKFFRDCGEQTIGPALERRIASMSSAQ
jgi:tetratricopeptide (TPR) repeat protein